MSQASDTSTYHQNVTDADLSKVAIPPEVGDRWRALMRTEAPTPHAAALIDVAAQALADAGMTVDMDGLCAAEGTRHAATFGDERLCTRCLLDSLILPFLTGEPVSIRSESPHSGTPITIEATPEGIDFAPEGAVMSIGVPREVPTTIAAVEAAGEAAFGPDLAYATACPFINGFASREAHDAWAEAHPEVASMAMGLEDAHAFAQGLATAMARRGD